MLCFCDYRAVFSINWDSNEPTSFVKADLSANFLSLRNDVRREQNLVEPKH